MDKIQALGLVQQARELIEGVNERLSEASKRQYAAAFTRMQNGDLPIEKITNTANGFYFYRAALVYHHAAAIRAILYAADQAALAMREDDWAGHVATLEGHISVLQKYKPDPTGKHLARGLVGDWAVEKEKRERAGGKISRHSKRIRLRGLAPDWRTQMFDGLGPRSKFRAALAVLSATGARPAEIALGVEVALADDGQLIFTIRGVKTHGGKYGQDTRTLTVRPESKETQFLVEQVRAAGRSIIVSVTHAHNLSNRVYELSLKVFPQLAMPISAYVFRHQLAADMKASAMSPADVSAALGHCVDETKGFYGAAQSARGNGGVSRVQASRPVKERTRERLRALENAHNRELGRDHTS